MAKTDHLNLKIVKQTERPDIVFSMARVSDTSRAFVGSSDFGVHAVDLQSDVVTEGGESLVGHSSYVTGVALAGDVIVSGSYDRQLIWWGSQTGEKIRTTKAHDRWIRGVVASPDGELIASVADDMVCRLWSRRKGTLIGELRGHEPKTPHQFPSVLYVCAFSPDGTRLATGDRVGKIVVWDVASGKQLATLEAPLMYTWDGRQRLHSIGGIRSLCFSPDSKLLAAGGIGQIGNVDHLGAKARVEVFDWAKGERVQEFAGDKFNGLVEHMAFEHDAKWLLAAGGDHKGFVMFLDVESGDYIRQDQAPMHVHEFALSKESDTLYAVGHRKSFVAEIRRSASF